MLNQGRFWKPGRNFNPTEWSFLRTATPSQANYYFLISGLLWQFWKLLSLGILASSNPHRNSSDPTDDLCLIRESKLADRTSGKRMRHQDELFSLQFAPRAGIATPKLNEIDGPVKLRPPRGFLDLGLSEFDRPIYFIELR